MSVHRWRILVLTLAAVAALGSQNVLAENDEAQVRITAQLLPGGQIEFALQQHDADGSWGDRLLPRARFFPATATVSRWLWSSPLTLDADIEVRIAARRIADGRVEIALQMREEESWSDRLLPRARFFPATATVSRWLTSGALTVPPTCQQGPAVPAGQSNLVGDCENLLAAAEALGGDLDWSASRAISSWEGITVDGGRVTRVDIPSRGLGGIFPEEFGALDSLRALNLADNRLTGEIPEGLGHLPLLAAVNFIGNDFSGRLLPLRWSELQRYDYIPLGDEMAVATAAARAAVSVRFSGEPSAAVHDALLKEFASVVEFFADQYGMVVTRPVTLLVLPSGTGGAYYDASDNTILLAPNAIHAMAHEYVHALQAQLQGLLDAPRWILEGVADYFDTSYGDATGWSPRQTRVGWTITNARASQDPLQIIEQGMRTVDGHHLAVGILATDYLASNVGEDALWDLHRRLANSSWPSAFEGAFGMPLDDFYEAFKVHRELVAPSLPQIQGSVLGPAGQPLESVHVWAHPIPDGPGANLDHTREDGTFAVAASTETVILGIYHPDCFSVRRSFDGESLMKFEIVEAINAGVAMHVGDSNVPNVTINFPWAPGIECPSDEPQ